MGLLKIEVRKIVQAGSSMGINDIAFMLQCTQMSVQFLPDKDVGSIHSCRTPANFAFIKYPTTKGVPQYHN